MKIRIRNAFEDGYITVEEALKNLGEGSYAPYCLEIIPENEAEEKILALADPIFLRLYEEEYSHPTWCPKRYEDEEAALLIPIYGDKFCYCNYCNKPIRDDEILYSPEKDIYICEECNSKDNS